MSEISLYTFLARVEQLPAKNTYYSFNCTTKIYNNGTFKIQKNSWYNQLGCPPVSHNGSMSEQELKDKTLEYLKRTRKAIFDLALNNQDKFQYFITLTFKYSDSEYSHDKVLKQLQNWLIVQRRNNPDMYYILVPEFHPTSTINRIHFHGLFGNCPSWSFTQAVSSKTGKPIFTKYGSKVYNLDNYNLGFTTVSFIDRPEEVCNYISKYATKDILKLVELKNKKKYWYSRNLDKVKTYKTDFTGNVKDLQLHYGMFYYDEFKRDNSSVEVGSFCLY